MEWPVLSLACLQNAGCGLLLAVLAAVLLYCTGQRRKKWPPGPVGWPLVGHLPSLGQKSHKSLAQWSERYGDIIAVRFGSKDAIGLNSYRAFQEAFLKQGANFAGKADLPFGSLFSNGGKGIVNAPYGNPWKEQRKFVLSAMRSLNTITSQEDIIFQEAQALISAVGRHGGRPCDIQPDIALSILNVTCVVVFGQRIQQNNPIFKRLVTSVQTISRTLGSLGLLNAFPWLSRLPFGRYPATSRKMESAVKQFRAVVADMVDEHRQSYDPAVTRDIVDAFLLELQKRTQEGRQENDSFTSDQMMQTIFDLFAAGIETVLSAFMWLVFYMARYPDLQSTVHEELDRVLKGDRVSFQHRRSLPLTEATVMEILRLSSPSPINFRATTCDVTLRGYRLPAGTWTLMNCWAVHRDPEQWTEPGKFNIRRFVDCEGKVCTPPAWRPFGIGRRICPGEQLSRMEFFLFFASLLQNFTLKLHVPDNDPIPSPEDGILGATLAPAPFKVCANVRQSN